MQAVSVYKILDFQDHVKLVNRKPFLGKAEYVMDRWVTQRLTQNENLHFEFHQIMYNNY